MLTVACGQCQYINCLRLESTEPDQGEEPGLLPLSRRRLFCLEASEEVQPSTQQQCYRGGAQTQRLATAKEEEKEEEKCSCSHGAGRSHIPLVGCLAKEIENLLTGGIELNSEERGEDYWEQGRGGARGRGGREEEGSLGSEAMKDRHIFFFFRLEK